MQTGSPAEGDQSRNFAEMVLNDPSFAKDLNSHAKFYLPKGHDESVKLRVREFFTSLVACAIRAAEAYFEEIANINKGSASEALRVFESVVDSDVGFCFLMNEFVNGEVFDVLEKRDQFARNTDKLVVKAIEWAACLKYDIPRTAELSFKAELARKESAEPRMAEVLEGRMAVVSAAIEEALRQL